MELTHIILLLLLLWTGFISCNNAKSFEEQMLTRQEILEGTSDFDWEACMTMNDTWVFKVEGGEVG